jgi:predicted ATPase
MEGKRLIRTIRLQNFLSYGPEAQEISLQPLNVLIGKNASGKTNLIEALTLLRAAPRDLAAAIREGGGIADWLWMGAETWPEAQLEAVVEYPDGQVPLRYKICFTQVGQRLELTDELIENEHSASSIGQDVEFFYRYQGGNPVLNVRSPALIAKNLKLGHGPVRREARHLQRSELSPDQSILSQRKDPDQYPELTYLGKVFGEIRVYGDWAFGHSAPSRLPQNGGLPNNFLSEDADNLALVLNDLQTKPPSKRKIMESLKEFYSGAEEILTLLYGGKLVLLIQEKGLTHPVPATNLSDGTLRYLSLLTLLCHPTPPPLLCIEEPELGLHPDVLPTIAELLVDASQRTQLIVTTHSDTLVSALTDVPEAVLVCEHDEAGTHLNRLDQSKLDEWLKKYSLGELWRMGEIGGN